MRRRDLLLAIAVAVLASPLFAQQSPRISGTITAGGSDCSVAARCVGLDVSGGGGAAIVASGFGTATITLEISTDATSLTTGTWTVQPETYNLATGATGSTFAANGYYVVPLKGSQWVRARASSYSSGTIAIAIGAAISAPIPQTLPVTGPLTDTQLRASAVPVTANAGTNLNTSALALDATVTGRLPAGGSPANGESNTNTNLSRIGAFNYVFNGSTWDRWTGGVTQSGSWSFAGGLTNNNAAPSTNLLGALGFRANASAPTWTEGNLVLGSVDLSGAVRMNCVTGCGGGTGGTAMADRASFTYGTTQFTPIGGVYHTSITALTAGQAGAAALTSNRAVYTSLFDASGNALLGQKTMAGSVPVVLPSDQFSSDTSGTLQSAAVANGNGTPLSVAGLASVVLTLNCSSCSGGTTINFEGQEDGSNFTALQAVQLGTNTIATTTTTAGLTHWQLPTGGLQTVRARISAYSAGTVTITGHATSSDFSPKLVNANIVGGSTGNGAASNTGSAVPAQADYQGVNVAGTLRGATGVNPSGSVYATQMDLTSVNGTTVVTGNGTAASSIRVSLASDSTGQVTLATGANTIGALTANQSVNAAQIGGTNTVTGGASGLLAVGGNAASGASDSANPVKVGGVFNTTQPTVTNAQRVDFQTTNRGAQIVATGADTFNVTVNTALPAGGNTIGAVTQASGPWTSNVTQFGGTNISTGTGASGAGIPRVTVANDSTVTANAGTNLNTSALALEATQVTGNTSLSSIDTKLSTLDTDVRGTGGYDTTLLAILRAILQQGTPKTAAGIKGSFGRMVTSTGDALDVNVKYPAAAADPCSDPTLIKQNVAISQTASSRLVVGGRSRVFVCSFFTFGADAESQSLVEGTGTTCGTATLAVVGGSTAANGPNFAATQGYAQGNGAAWIAATAVSGNDLCLLQSGAGRVAGNLTYVSSR
jgi:hypothetical protein